MTEEKNVRAENCEEKLREGDGRIMLGQRDLELIGEVVRRELQPFKSDMTEQMNSFKNDMRMITKNKINGSGGRREIGIPH